jgi:hypothetical protein
VRGLQMQQQFEERGDDEHALASQPHALQRDQPVAAQMSAVQRIVSSVQRDMPSVQRYMSSAQLDVNAFGDIYVIRSANDVALRSANYGRVEHDVDCTRPAHENKSARIL